ncbi:asparagine-linked glycosylation protein [Orbilia oligospora]|nr:asparagine-linked glycosylation protein [Orbilia oligospora]KAF3251909.1 asparagine-linked glycosylation protein [Orbilia oligospora]KAF3257003.1 asparagine-linked glycosylation protein [Orbilia oligospora]KAF3286313.1 asparagine-linked glycosylation protein [Orbilia oligospora]
MEASQSHPPLDSEEVCTHCAWVPYAIVALPVVLPLLLLILHGPLLRLFGFYIRSLNGDKREILFRVSSEEALRANQSKTPTPQLTTIAGFFHPYCNAGGGGERVLWAAIHANQLHSPHILNIVYTGDQATKSTILSNVQTRFDIHLNPSLVQFIHLQKRHLVSSSAWPRFTLLGQSLGSIFLALEAFGMLVPDVYIDSMGYAFTVLLAKKVFGIPTAAYVHYPTISTDMLGSLSPEKSVKKRYWQLFAMLYSYAGSGIDVVVANSSWTAGHLNSLWRGRQEGGAAAPKFDGGLAAAIKWISGRQKKGDIEVLFPPCAVKKLAEKVSIGKKREDTILYIAQFRSEKNHILVLQAFEKFLKSAPEELKNTKLVLVGTVREDQDEKKVYELRLLAHELQVDKNVVFVTNAPWGDVIGWLGKASLGVNAMWNEHFGIGVVEYQAAGLIGVVHDSGGPKLDIVVEVDGLRTGYHATTAEEFAQGFKEALSLSDEDTVAMRERARKSSLRFSEEIFEEQWNSVMDTLLGLLEGKKRK